MDRRAQTKPEDAHTPADKQRLDKWIWFARFLRNRVAAAELIQAGHVRVNGKRVSTPGHFVKLGDVLTLALPRQTIMIKITAFAAQRGNAAFANTLFIKLTSPQDEKRDNSVHLAVSEETG